MTNYFFFIENRFECMHYTSGDIVDLAISTCDYVDYWFSDEYGNYTSSDFCLLFSMLDFRQPLDIGDLRIIRITEKEYSNIDF